MAGNTFGKIFSITTCGESHGGALGVIIDGCPAGLKISHEDIQKELDRRKPGQSILTTARQEEDKIQILSGVSDGVTTGAPILLLTFNKDAKSEDYLHLKDLYRPGHADFTYEKKFGLREWRGGGRSSARETLARVAAGAIAKKYLQEIAGISFLGYIEKIGDIQAQVDYKKINIQDVEANIVRCPDEKAAEKMIELINDVRSQGDSIGGVVFCAIKNVPLGLGEPVFDKLPADLAKAMLSINATKGFEIGAGFSAVNMRGSENNDSFYTDEKGIIHTKTNNCGGTLGGISNGEDIYFRVAFKPTPTIAKEQDTIDKNGQNVKLKAAGRHDPCVALRAVPVVEAMTALVIMDHYLRYKK